MCKRAHRSPAFSYPAPGHDMKRRTFWNATLLAAALCAGASPALADNAADCPNDGVVRMGVEPFDTGARLVPIYDSIGELMGEKIHCTVQVFIATNYNAESEAVGNG